MTWIGSAEQLGPPTERRRQRACSSGAAKPESFAAPTRLIKADELKLHVSTLFSLRDAAKALERTAAGQPG